MRKFLPAFIALTTLSFGAHAQCTSNFSGTQSATGNTLLNVNFIDSSYYGLPFSGQKKQFKIYFGDGNTFTGSGIGTGNALTSHNYATAGTKNVALVIKDIDSVTGTIYCMDSFVRQITIAYPRCGTILNASGTGTTRSFTAFTPAGNTGMSYSWTYGDGGTGTGTPVSHTYAASGTYTVTLTATNTTAACTYTNTTTVNVYIPPPALNCGTLHAGFNTSVTSNVLTTTNTSTTVSTPPYVMVATWDYGDGGTSTGFSPPTHNYSAPGIYTVKLKMVWRDSFFTTSCSDSILHSVAITSVPTPANVISGYVVYDTLTYGINYFKVWLIQYDSATNLLSAVDSQVTASSSLPYYAFGNHAAGSYRTKAAVYGGPATGTGLTPTYHDSSVYWNLASVINHAGGTTSNQRIYVRAGTIGTGPGFIGGNVSYGANKGTANGGAAGIMIFLRNNVMKVVKRTYTDSNGDYSFAGIPLGAYSVWPEELNYATIPVTPIVLDNSGMNFPLNNFTMDISKRTIWPKGLLQIPVLYGVPGIQVSPVPAHSQVTVSWSGVNGNAAGLVITTATGQTVKSVANVDIASGFTILDVHDLAAGLYFLHGTGALTGAPVKLLIQ